MAKKRRKERKQLSRERGVQQAAANVGLVDTRAPIPTQAKPSTGLRETGPSNVAIASVDEYSYIRSDLKRIAILTASIVAILIALSFVL